jgi:DNA-binding transcriptional LysR family regulator
MTPLTLDQVRVFLAVIDEGSFSAAARKLRRAQSAVSYGVATLERLLGVSLFERSGRAPTLSEAGRALVPQARLMIENADDLAASAQRMHEGLEPRVTLAVEVLYPIPVLVTALKAFREKFPSVWLLLRTEALGAVAELVLNGTCQLGISVEAPFVPAHLERTPLSNVQMVAVVAPDHELARHEGAIPTRVLKRHTQLVLTDRSRLTEGFDAGVAGGPNWRIADLDTKHQFLRAGLGWGTLPLHMIADDLESARLRRLRLQQDDSPKVQLVAIHLPGQPLGPATRWLMEQLGKRCTEAQEQLGADATGRPPLGPGDAGKAEPRAKVRRGRRG